VGFSVNKEGLYRFERETPALEPIVQHLLRAYPGIFDQPVPVSEKSIAWGMKKPLPEVTRELRALQQQGIVDYSPAKDSPQLYLMQPRQKAEDLLINVSHHQRRKKQYEARLGAMVQYVKETHACRSQLLDRYFGDEATVPCGICDNCLQQKKIRKQENGIPKK
jgi:ATP-dependent DNA helicase RecQ